MNRWRKTITLLLMLLFALSLFSVTAYAEGTDAASMACTSCGGTGLYNGAECGDCGGTGLLTSQSRMAFSFWALVPPIVAIILALITKEVYSSLFVGIVLGGLFYTNFNPVLSLDTMINDGIV